MQESIIRLAGEGDVPAISELQHLWAEEEITYGFQPATVEQIQVALGRYYFVAEVRGKVIGFISGSVDTSPGFAILPADQAYLSIDDLYVAPMWRSQGIGQQLMDTILAAALDADLHAALVYSSTKDVQRVLHFYQRNGFQSWYVQMFRQW